MKLLDDYFEIEKQIHGYFGYEGDWHVYPIDDNRKYFWCLNGDYEVRFADSIEELKTEEGNCYASEIIRGTESIYETKDFTAIINDTNCDGNKFFSIFDNSKKIELEEED